MAETLHITDPLIARILAFIAERDAEHGAQAWMVGGFVRDQLLGRPLHDLDLIVPAGAIDATRAIARRFDGAYFVLDAERDVARAILNRSEGGEATLTVDIARLRSPLLFEDLALRDFTINAMAAAVVPGTGRHGQAVTTEVVDPFGGRADLARGLLRAVGDQAFRDDPLRALRGVRQAVELGFRLEGATCDLIRRDGALLTGVAAERVRDEVQRIVTAPGAWHFVQLLAQLDLLRHVLPEMAALAGVTQSEPHYLDAYNHTRSVMAHAEGILALIEPGGRYNPPEALARQCESPLTSGCIDEPEPAVIAGPWQWQTLAEILAPYAEALRAHLAQPLGGGRTRRDLLLWAALAHDWGKAVTRSVGTDWRVHFYGHEHEGARLAEDRLRLLAFSAHEAECLGHLVELHMRPAALARHWPPGSRALYRFYRDAGPDGPDVTLLALADKLATRAPAGATAGAPTNASDQEFWPHLLEVARQAFDAYFRQRQTLVEPALLLDGRAVMAELALPPGPEIGRLLDGLREAQAVGEVTTPEEARAWLHAARDGAPDGG